MNHRPALIAALCGGYFLVLLDVTAINVALPSLAADLRASGPGLAWVVDAYATPLAALLPAAGAIGDRLGHRRVVVAGFLLFGAASVFCASAHSMVVLVTGRGLQGVAAALVLPGTLALLTESTSDERGRARVVAWWAAAGGAALPAGPLLGGLLVGWLGWPSVFWLNVPVVVAAVAVVAAAPFPARPVSSRRVDWLGAGLLTLLLAAVVTSIVEVREAPVAAGLAGAVAVVAAGALVVAERRAADPLFHVEPAARRPLARACAVAGLMNLCSLGALFVLTQVFQEVRGLSPWGTGLLVLPAMLPLPLLGPLAGRSVTAAGVWRTAAAGLVLGAVGFALIAVSVTGHLLVLIIGLVVWGSGLGLLTPAVVTAAVQTTPRSAGTAAGASNASRQLGGALGVATAGVLGGGRAVPHAAPVLIGAALCFAIAGALVARIRP